MVTQVRHFYLHILVKTYQQILVVKKIFVHRLGKTATYCTHCQFGQHTQQDRVVAVVRVGSIVLGV